jgi:hypothetical protein
MHLLEIVRWDAALLLMILQDCSRSTVMCHTHAWNSIWQCVIRGQNKVGIYAVTCRPPFMPSHLLTFRYTPLCIVLPYITPCPFHHLASVSFPHPPLPYLSPYFLPIWRLSFLCGFTRPFVLLSCFSSLQPFRLCCPSALSTGLKIRFWLDWRPGQTSPPLTRLYVVICMWVNLWVWLVRPWAVVPWVWLPLVTQRRPY